MPSVSCILSPLWWDVPHSPGSLLEASLQAPAILMPAVCSSTGLRGMDVGFGGAWPPFLDLLYSISVLPSAPPCSPDPYFGPKEQMGNMPSHSFGPGRNEAVAAGMGRGTGVGRRLQRFFSPPLWTCAPLTLCSSIRGSFPAPARRLARPAGEATPTLILGDPESCKT